MKTLLDKDGNFMFTFEGDDIDVSGDEYVDCTIVEGDEPFQAFLQANLAEEERVDQLILDDEQSAIDFADSEALDLADMKQRLEVLEQKVADLENS